MVVAISAMTHNSDVSKCYEAGMDRFLNKPPDMKKLRDTILEMFPEFSNLD